jgi:hypothetical protein
MKRELPRTYVRAVTLMARGRVHLASARSESLLTAYEIFEELSREERSNGTKETAAQPESSSQEREAAARTFAEVDTRQGEWVLIPERIVVSPGLGRFHPVYLEEGPQIK